jgi:hypothetical protein
LHPLTISIILILIILTSCEKIEPEISPRFENTYAEAMNEMNEFKGALLGETGTNSFLLQSLNTVKPGEIWIRNLCDNSLQNRSENSRNRITTDRYTYAVDTMEIMPRSVSFGWKRTWAENNDLKSRLRYEMAETLFRASYYFPEVETFHFNINLNNIQRIYLKNPEQLFKDYLALLSFYDEKTKGNILVTGVIQGQLQIKYKALDKYGKNLNIDLSPAMNEIIRARTFLPKYIYFKKTSSDQVSATIEEGNTTLSTLIVEYMNIPDEIQNLSFISQNMMEACDFNARSPNIKKLPSICTELGREILELTLRSENKNEWYPVWKNKTENTLTYFKYNLIVKNRFGQDLGRVDYFEPGPIYPGDSIIGDKITELSPGIITYMPRAPKTIVNLYEVELELQLQTYDIIR